MLRSSFRRVFSACCVLSIALLCSRAVAVETLKLETIDFGIHHDCPVLAEIGDG